MATVYLQLVLAVLFLVGPVLGIDVDLREQDIEEHGGNIQIHSVNIEPRNLLCRARGGVCVNVNNDCPSNRNTSIVPAGRPYCMNNRRCCVGTEECTSKGCIFGGEVYPHECYLNDTCFDLRCIDGTWNFKGFNKDKGCGNCTFGGEPIVYPFDHLSPPQPYVSQNKTYWSGVFNTGEFVMAQPLFEVPAEFYVKSHFADFSSCTWGQHCVEGVTYHELGITITMILPPADDLLGEIKVSVNGDDVTIGQTVEYFYGTGGAILVFRHYHIGIVQNVNCIGVLGTKGLSVALCERPLNYTTWTGGFPWAYILAMPRLEAPLWFEPSQLYGLCNTWTGHDQDCFFDQNGTCVDNWVCEDPSCFQWNGHPQISTDLLYSWNANKTN